ncbi:hypothetical protein G5I_00308 [Acromyrmex echinatior]|uniref:Semaphorin-1A n=1 Tax=Acromyrmex echinatior TaxID=103372 RepID=F4W4I7_ACREC|nr:hypothetical protein G5I_00308 [Acromyrmex echinatior]
MAPFNMAGVSALVAPGPAVAASAAHLLPLLLLLICPRGTQAEQDEPSSVIRQSKLNYFLEARPTNATVHSRSKLIYCRRESIVLLADDAIAERTDETLPKTRKLTFIRFHCTLADISREPMRNQKWTKSKLR